MASVNGEKTLDQNDSPKVNLEKGLYDLPILN
jgi:hypothetical protein